MAFNLFPQTDFRQMDLNYVLAEVKRAANLTDRVDDLEDNVSTLTGRVDGLSGQIWDPDTGLWKAVADIHTVNASQQAQINALIAAKVFAVPEDYGAAGDGVTDDTSALQAALNSDKPVYLKATYGISDTVHVNKDKVILCGESAVIKTLGRVTYALRFGDDPTTGSDAAISGLIQVLWFGGTLTCDSTNYFDYGFYIERCLNSCFYGVSVTNCIGTGFRWSGDYGANAICNNCIVRGPDAGWYGITGFLVGRNDQRIFNCSAVNMATGFFADRGYVRFEGCYCWLTRVRDAQIQDVVGYDIVSSNCAVIDCTIDTLPTGVKLHPTSRNFYAQALAWYNNDTVIADASGFALFRGSETGITNNGFVSGVASSPWSDPVNICTDVSGLTIIGFMIPDATNIQDMDSVTQLMPNCTGQDGLYHLCCEISAGTQRYFWDEIPVANNLVGSAIVGTAQAG